MNNETAFQASKQLERQEDAWFGFPKITYSEEKRSRENENDRQAKGHLISNPAQVALARTVVHMNLHDGSRRHSSRLCMYEYACPAKH